MSLARAPIGEILLRHEHLRPRELERLLAEDRKHRLVSLLVLRAEIEIDDATLALSEQSGYPGAFERHLEQRDGALARTFPPALMRNFGVVPLTRTVAGALVVVARDPSPALADVLTSELRVPIELAIAPAIFLERLIQRLAGGAPSALPPELPPIDRAPPARHRKSISVLIHAPLPETPIVVESSMPSVEVPTELIQPGKPTITLELDDDEPADEPQPPTRPTRPIPSSEIRPLLVEPEPVEEAAPPISTRPTRPSVSVPIVPELDERPAAPVRATPNIIKRPPTPLPVPPQPVARKITEDPAPEPDPVMAHGRTTYPKLEPPPPSAFDADTARPQKPIEKPKPPAPVAPIAPPATPAPTPRNTDENWDDFEDSKVGMGVPPPEVLEQMSSIGMTLPPVEVPPVEAHADTNRRTQPISKRAVVTAVAAQPRATGSGAQPPRAGTAPPIPQLPKPPEPSGPKHARPGSVPRAGTAPISIPPLPERKPGTPPPVPGANIVRDIEKAMSRATADRLLMKHVATRWSALLLVTVAGDRAKGARGHGSRLQAGVEAIELPIAASGLLQGAVDPGAAPPDGKDPLFDLLGGPAQPSAAPVVVDGAVVAVLAAGDALEGGSPAELASLASALAVAYQRFPAK